MARRRPKATAADRRLSTPSAGWVRPAPESSTAPRPCVVAHSAGADATYGIHLPKRALSPFPVWPSGARFTVGRTPVPPQ